MTARARRWWDADTDGVNTAVIAYVSEVERQQSFLFERFFRLAALYDPYFAHQSGWGFETQRKTSQLTPEGDVSENVIASNVDTVTAIVAAAEVRARFLTDDADWTMQRNARHLDWYAEGLAKLLGMHDICVTAFRDAALKGTGLAKVYVDAHGQVRVERVLVDDVIVDEGECRNGGWPRQFHHRVFADQQTLAAAFPDHAEAIESASQRGMGGSSRTLWAGYRPLDNDQVVAIESWHLPIGARGKDGYLPGRHTICITGHDLLDEEWHKPRFPFVRMVWTERAAGWYGIGGAERVAGHQRRINKLNWQIDRQHDQHAVPTTYVRMADAHLAVKTVNRAGTIVPIKGEMPQTVIPPAVSPETYRRHDSVRDSSYEEFGVSRLAATAKKPSGLDSGIALREYRDMTTQRFALQEKSFERFFLDLTWLVLDAARDLGERAPVVTRRSRFGVKHIEWAKLDMDELRVQIAAASTISRTPAGRMQTVLEWAQAGIVSQDEARRLLRHPDIERSLSLYTAAIEDIERTIEELLDGEWVVPEPFQNLQMGVWRMQQEYLLVRGQGAPEPILEGLRQWVVQAAHILSMQQEPAMGAQASATGAGEMPPMGGAMPQQAEATSAFAPAARLGLRMGSGT